ncbi:MAG: DHH family phosphoesterase [Clostridia bacterium]|nr:DHH family phosphoesterase [Clostridia bacterium]
MKVKGFWHDLVLIAVAAAVALVFTAITAQKQPKLALAQGAALLAVLLFAFLRALNARTRYKRFLRRMTEQLDFTDHKVLSAYPFPVAVCDAQGTVDWCSDRFLTEIAGGRITSAARIEEFSNGVPLQTLISEDETAVQVGERYYSVYTVPYQDEEAERCILIFLENTRLKQTELAYVSSRPYCVIVELDNLDDVRGSYRDSERAEIRSRIEAALDAWAEGFDSFTKRVTDDRYMILTEQSNFQKMVEGRFAILETVRNFEYKGKRVGVTLSIGASGGDTIRLCERSARKALEMALGRGGDQVAIRTKNGYDFIGGVSKSAETINTVKSRVMAAALAELIKASNGVFLMGHTYTDLDAIGASIGLAAAAASFGVPAYLVADPAKSLAGALLDRAAAEMPSLRIVQQAQALELMNRRSLLIVCDTHVPSFMEFPEVFEAAETRVIVDHHRLAAEPEQEVVLFHHDPGASSASELVAELLQYINPDLILPKLAAEALLAGMMLDTKGFVVRVGVRTFEAAAFLREKGADTVSVKRLFANPMEVNRERNRVISAAERYRGCAISAVEDDVEEVRIVAAQAADELLNVSETLAAFVLYRNGDAINISARSYGEINVQLIMEALSGGGHRTMAACRLPETTIEEAMRDLKAEIDRYFEENT